MNKTNAIFDDSDPSLACGVIPVNWYNYDWAISCTFQGNDMAQIRTKGELCTDACDTTPGCTHFDWTNLNNGTCFLKSGGVNKSEAFFNQMDLDHL